MRFANLDGPHVTPDDSVWWIPDPFVRGLVHLGSTERDERSPERTGAAFLFLEPATGAPGDPALRDEADRRKHACHVWLSEAAVAGELRARVSDARLLLLPHAFAFALEPHPGVVRTYRNAKEPLRPHVVELLEAWARTLGTIWPAWARWLADAEGARGPAEVRLATTVRPPGENRAMRRRR